MNIKMVKECINKDVEEFDIVELILSSAPPFEWARSDNSHPIQKIGYYYFGIGEGFKFNEEKVREEDESTLWKLYALIQMYWLAHYKEWYNGRR